MRTLIVAGNYQQAREYAAEDGLQRSEWRYVQSVADLRGLGVGYQVLFRGTWYERRDAADLVLEKHGLELFGAKVVGL
jgi:hypothetical protein